MCTPRIIHPPLPWGNSQESVAYYLYINIFFIYNSASLGKFSRTSALLYSSIQSHYVMTFENLLRRRAHRSRQGQARQAYAARGRRRCGYHVHLRHHGHAQGRDALAHKRGGVRGWV